VVVSVLLTAGVYGVVGFIVKMDDIGVHLARRRTAPIRSFGRGLVKAMPPLLQGLTVVGTAAMLWVGGGILVHGLEHFELQTVPHAVEWLSHSAGALPGIGAAAGWLAFAAGSAALGFVIGAALVAALHVYRRAAGAPPGSLQR